jgi:hypothetical protein
VLGTEYPFTLTSMNNLAAILSRQGKYEQEEKMHGQALARRERVLGKMHPSTLTGMNKPGYYAKPFGQVREARGWSA